MTSKRELRQVVAGLSRENSRLRNEQIRHFDLFFADKRATDRYIATLKKIIELQG